jgi:hypothetical protein
MRTLVILVAAVGMLWAQSGATARRPSRDFAAYPAVLYHGPAKQPGFGGSQRPYAEYRTRIRASVAEGVRFGGHYAVMVAGCGTSCRFGFMTDVRTGLVYDLPHGGEDYVEIVYRVHPDSRLLRAHWVRMSKDYDRIGCVFEDFVWTGKAFRSLGRRTTADDCPDEADAAPAYD